MSAILLTYSILAEEFHKLELACVSCFNSLSVSAVDVCQMSPQNLKKCYLPQLSVSYFLVLLQFC